MSEMIERVARAIEDHLMLSEYRGEEARNAARAAIEAMKVPTVEMVVAGTEDWLCIRAIEDRAEVIWDAMLDAALTEPA